MAETNDRPHYSPVTPEVLAGYEARYQARMLRMVWRNMLNRCYVPTTLGFARYGGRGIRVCPRWRRSFRCFSVDMGLRPEGMTLDRIDNNGPYSPENCRWASRAQQARNRRGSHQVTFEGVTRPVMEWVALTGITKHRFYSRIARGRSCDDLLASHGPLAPSASPEAPSVAEGSGERKGAS